MFEGNLIYTVYFQIPFRANGSLYQHIRCENIDNFGTFLKQIKSAAFYIMCPQVFLAQQQISVRLSMALVSRSRPTIEPEETPNNRMQKLAKKIRLEDEILGLMSILLARLKLFSHLKL